ncbi:ElaB/YqjD/DUF883 family membrane-anchored ribosome-binding protein [Litoreibacter meonggei]|uniref:ElaB/YqjD/DUF883 family membrane-anchored ribosome-binding protein n=1 Tax=Litoreibacter meonggei TaxID=1049199 RepID=A0A497W8X7_9RHOB|nr:DUF883 family protein [Litoreibacter meonggei]RLJ51657.1 ElaB/YqjD/DUF883 family membrane-anchored ribosome-binding protein [Litoreibacter meonggei]
MASTMTKLSTKSKSATAEDLAEQIETLRNDLGSLTQTIADLGKAKGDEALASAKSTADNVRAKAADSAETARLQAMELQDQANDFVKNQPATALGIAAGLGFLVGFFGARK